MLHLSTLGYTPNPLIVSYQKAFLEKLQLIWKREIGGDMPPDDFLLYPDAHSLLLAGVRGGSTDKAGLLSQVKTYYDGYLSRGGVHDIDENEIIVGTKIPLTMRFENPDVDKNTHPDHKSLSASYGDMGESEWRKLFADAFSIVAQVSPGFMNEIDMLLRKVIPFGISTGGHNSGSYGDAIGHIIMSYPINIDSPKLAVLEAILHEYNHNKINLIMQTEKLILSDMREQYYSPYRPDPRHIHGIYLGVHALAGAYWVILQAHRSGVLQLSTGWQEKAVLFTLKNGLSFQVLDRYAELTPLGREFLEEMRNVHNECLVCIRDAGIPSDAISRAHNSMKSHFMNVQKNFPGIFA